MSVHSADRAVSWPCAILDTSAHRPFPTPWRRWWESAAPAAQPQDPVHGKHAASYKQGRAPSPNEGSFLPFLMRVLFCINRGKFLSNDFVYWLRHLYGFYQGSLVGPLCGVHICRFNPSGSKLFGKNMSPVWTCTDMFFLSLFSKNTETTINRKFSLYWA